MTFSGRPEEARRSGLWDAASSNFASTHAPAKPSAVAASPGSPPGPPAPLPGVRRPKPAAAPGCSGAKQVRRPPRSPGLAEVALQAARVASGKGSRPRLPAPPGGRRGSPRATPRPAVLTRPGSSRAPAGFRPRIPGGAGGAGPGRARRGARLRGPARRGGRRPRAAAESAAGRRGRTGAGRAGAQSRAAAALALERRGRWTRFKRKHARKLRPRGAERGLRGERAREPRRARPRRPGAWPAYSAHRAPQIPCGPGRLPERLPAVPSARGRHFRESSGQDRELGGKDAQGLKWCRFWGAAGRRLLFAAGVTAWKIHAEGARGP